MPHFHILPIMPMAYFNTGIDIYLNKKWECVLTNDCNKSKRMTLGSHNHSLPGEFLSLVSLALVSWLFSISHWTKWVEERDDRGTKYVSWGLAGVHRAHATPLPGAPFRGTPTSRRTPVCSVLSQQILFLRRRVHHRESLNIKSRQKILFSTNKHWSILSAGLFV